MRGERLKALRDALGYSQHEVSDLTGISQSQINRYESGAVIPSSEMVTKLAKFYGVTSDYLLGLVDEPTGRFTEEGLSPAEWRLIRLFRAGALGQLLQVITNLANDKEKEKSGK